MLFYYIDTIEQVKKKDEQGQVIEGINEYGKRDIIKNEDGTPAPYEVVQSKYFKKLSDVSNDLVSLGEDKNHFYMDIRITDSDGVNYEKKQIGKRQ